jgi:HAE1 family hydrophobic/amphiphilic exporter-1
MQLIEAFVRNPVKVSVGVLIVALFGFIALVRMPMQLTPEVEIPRISIRTRWPGASPNEIEREIVQEQEEQLQSVEGVTRMSAECRDSQGRISLEFRVGTDLSEALLKVNSRLQQVPEYPEDADEPVISTADTSSSPIAYFILRPWVASAQQVAEFQAQHPDLQELLEPARRAHNSGLRTQRFKSLVEQHPEIKQRIATLLPPEGVAPADLQDFAEDFIKSRFERVPGISNSDVRGGREEELQVLVDPQKLASRNLTIYDLRNALRTENRDISAGDLWEGKRRYVVRTLGRYRNPEQVGDTIVGQGDNGAPIYLRDVAQVQLDFKKSGTVAKNFGVRSLSITAVREAGANVLDVMEGLRKARRELNENLLYDRGLELIQVYDQTDYIYSAIELVVWNIVVGAILTVGVLLIFLRSGRATLVIALAIPTSIIGTFLMLNLMGRSLNVISLAGLAFALGMLVDNAVVVLENCYRHAQMGDKPFVSAVRGAKEVWGAVVASTLTTLAVFLPVLFVEEEAGQLFRDIALAISSAVGLSLLVSITVIPTAAARLLRNDDAGSGSAGDNPTGRVAHRWLKPADAIGRYAINTIVGVNRFLQKSILLRTATVIAFVGTAFVLTYSLMPQVEYLPPGNRNLVIAIMLLPPGYSIDRALEFGNELEESIRPYWDVNLDDPDNGELEYPPISDYFFYARGSQVFMGLRSADKRRTRQLADLIQEVTANSPGVITRASQRSLFPRSLGTGRSVDIEITGPDLEVLIDVGKKIFEKVPQVVVLTEQMPLDDVTESDTVLERDEEAGIATVLKESARAFPEPSLELNSPEIHLVRKTKRAADMGVSTAELGYTVNALVDGAYASDYFIGGRKIDLTIIGNERFAERTQDLGGLEVATPSGDLTRLDGLASLQFAGGPEEILHRERERAITISVSPPIEMPLEQAIQMIDQEIIQPGFASGDIPPECQVNLAGTADKLVATWKALRWNFLLALLVTYLLMAALFESWLYPFIIILTVPLGAVGGLLGLGLLNQYLQLLPYSIPQQLDVLTMLGFVILIGTVVNNPILIVHQTINHMRYDAMLPNESILASVRSRIRPIFMTTITTLLGLCPLVLFPGAGSELYRGLGAVVLGGLVVSTLFTLVLVPTLLSLMLDARAWLERRRQRPVDHTVTTIDESSDEQVPALTN